GPAGPAARAMKAAAPRVVIAGAGVHAPYQVSLDSLKAVGACDVLFTELEEPEATAFLRLFCADVRAVPEGEAGPSAMLAEARPGRSVALVTRGHPFVAGTLARRLVREAREAGAEVDVYGAVSSFDTTVSLASELGYIDWDATHHYPHEVLTEHGVVPHKRIPTILTLPRAAAAREGQVRRLLEALAKAYGRRHKVFLYGPRPPAPLILFVPPAEASWW
ncbi:MAG: hypothetical protein FD126_3429, partial [Elusimicrobia bacterium]